MHPDRTEFTQLIARATYPTDRDAITAFVRDHGTGDGVVHLAAHLPDRTYRSAHDVRTALDTVIEKNDRAR